MRVELLKKGVERELVEEKLRKIDKSQWDGSIEKLVEKKAKMGKGLSKQKQRQKLISFLQRRGFRYERIKKVIDETLEKR